MAMRIQLPTGQSVVLDGPVATIGTDPGCNIVLPAEQGVRPHHARIKNVANRWMIESDGDWPLQVGQDVPGRKLWLSPGGPDPKSFHAAATVGCLP